MVFFVLNPKKGVFYESLLSKMAKRDRLCYSVCSSGYIGIPMRTLFFLVFLPNAGATKDGYFPQKEIKSLPYNSFFKSSMSGRALRSRSGISLDAR